MTKQINAFHPDYVKTHMPDFLATIRSEEKAKENGQLYGAKARLREANPDEPVASTIDKFPKLEKRKLHKEKNV